MQTDTYGICQHFMANDCHFLFLGACTGSVCSYDSQCPRGIMIHVAVGSYELLLMQLVYVVCYMLPATVINVHTVRSVLLLMWLIYIKASSISQSPTAASYREEVQGIFFLFILLYLPPPPPHTLRGTCSLLQSMWSVDSEVMCSTWTYRRNNLTIIRMIYFTKTKTLAGVCLQ